MRADILKFLYKHKDTGQHVPLADIIDKILPHTSQGILQPLFNKMKEDKVISFHGGNIEMLGQRKTDTEAHTVRNMGLEAIILPDGMTEVQEYIRQDKLDNLYQKQTNTLFWAVVIAGLSFISTCFSIYFQATDKTEEELQKIEKSLKEQHTTIQSISLSLQKISSSIAVLTKDSVSIAPKK